MDEDELTVAEIAAERGLASSTVRNWVTSGRLPGRLVGTKPRRWLVYRRDLDAFLASQTRPDVGLPRLRRPQEPTGSDDRGDAAAERDDWSDAPGETATLNLARTGATAINGSNARSRASSQAARQHIREGDSRWGPALAAFSPFHVRLGALAEAADALSRGLAFGQFAHATQAPRRGAILALKRDGLAPELAPSAVRPGPQHLWDALDDIVNDVLGPALEAGEIAGISAGFAKLSGILTELADATEPGEPTADGSGARDVA